MVWNDPAVGGDDAEVGSPGPQRLGHVGRLSGGRVEDRNLPSDREAPSRASQSLSAPGRGTVRLRHDSADDVIGVEQPLQGGYRELRRPEEHDYHLPARDSFLIFLTIRSFWRPRERSTKSVPSR